jgi:hypothetical protein
MMGFMLATFVRLPLLKAGRRFESMLAYPRLRAARSTLAEEVLADLRTEGVHVTTVERLLGDAAPVFRATLGRALPLLEEPPDARCWTARHASTDLSLEALLARLPEFYLLGLNARLLSVAEQYLRVPVAYHGAVLRRSFADAHAAGPRLWHRDIEDLHVLRTVVYLSDVEEEHGPFEYIPRHNRPVRRALRRGAPLRTDEEMRAVVPAAQWRRVTGPAGTVVIADSARTFHHQSRQRGGQRTVLMLGHASRRPSGRPLALSHCPVEAQRERLERLLPPAHHPHVFGWRAA